MALNVGMIQSITRLSRGARLRRPWHDTYNMPFEDLWLYLKFAGETLIDLRLT